MESEKGNTITTPPRLIDAFTTGFNTVANNIYLVLFPLLFDLLLWFGPRIQVKDLLLPVSNAFFTKFLENATPEMSEVMTGSQDLWQSILGRINLVGLLQSFPVGVFSLMASIKPVQNPLGAPLTWEVNSSLQLIGIWLVFALLGLMLGSLYFHQVARCCSKEPNSSSFRVIAIQALQTILLTIFLILLIILLTVPTSILISVMVLINLLIAQLVLILVLLVFVWLFLPLFFSPHGIFYYNQRALSAMLTSARVVRFSLPATTLFILLVVLLGQGINLIWAIPPETSWMMLVGIAGHAFTSTGLLASSFIYYRNNYQWLQETLQRLAAHRFNV